METVASRLVSVESLVCLAIEAWRLDRWLSSMTEAAGLGVPHRVARQIHAALHREGVDILDLTGQQYEPGMAVEIVDAIEDSNIQVGKSIIDDMIIPIVTLDGTVVRYGQIITRRNGRLSKDLP